MSSQAKACPSAPPFVSLSTNRKMELMVPLGRSYRGLPPYPLAHRLHPCPGVGPVSSPSAVVQCDGGPQAGNLGAAPRALPLARKRQVGQTWADDGPWRCTQSRKPTPTAAERQGDEALGGGCARHCSQLLAWGPGRGWTGLASRAEGGRAGRGYVEPPPPAPAACQSPPPFHSGDGARDEHRGRA